MTHPPAPARVRIDHLTLDLRGSDPSTARAAAPLLGQALGAALGGRSFGGGGGGVPMTPATPAEALAAQIAKRLAGHIEGQIARHGGGPITVPLASGSPPNPRS